MFLFIGGRLSASCNCSRDREKESRSYHIHEILIEPVAGQVRFALLSVGGFLGIGDTKIAVPWQAFQIIEDGKLKWVLDATREQMQNAPRVEGKNYDRLYAQETAKLARLDAVARKIGGRKNASNSGPFIRETNNHD
jgi:hypothetical protein